MRRGGREEEEGLADRGRQRQQDEQPCGPGGGRCPRHGGVCGRVCGVWWESWLVCVSVTMMMMVWCDVQARYPPPPPPNLSPPRPPAAQSDTPPPPLLRRLRGVDRQASRQSAVVDRQQGTHTCGGRPRRAAVNSNSKSRVGAIIADRSSSPPSIDSSRGGARDFIESNRSNRPRNPHRFRCLISRPFPFHIQRQARRRGRAELGPPQSHRLSSTDIIRIITS
jgi:hypothetical protein